MADAPVRREHKFHARLFRGREQSTISESIPTLCVSCNNRMSGEGPGDAARRSVVKDNEHRREQGRADPAF
jgi:hypothetical protein